MFATALDSLQLAWDYLKTEFLRLLLDSLVLQLDTPEVPQDFLVTALDPWQLDSLETGFLQVALDSLVLELDTFQVSLNSLVMKMDCFL